MLDWLKRNVENILSKKVKKQQVSFTKENGTWYFDFPNYPFAKANLAMVAGSDRLLDLILISNNAEDKSHVTVEITFSDKPLCEFTPQANISEGFYGATFHLSKKEGDLFGGYFYNVDSTLPIQEAYFCPVMLFTYGRYPEYIYGEVINIS
jgi:hypothetical protein